MCLLVTNADDHTLVAFSLAHDLGEVCLAVANHSKVRLVDNLASALLCEVITLLEKLAERMLGLLFLLGVHYWHTIWQLRLRLHCWHSVRLLLLLAFCRHTVRLLNFFLLFSQLV